MKTDQTGIEIRVIPGARRDAIEIADDGGLKVRLRARAVDGKANAALREYLAEMLSVSRSSIEIVTGEHSRSKVIRVRDLPAAAARERLLAAALS